MKEKVLEKLMLENEMIRRRKTKELRSNNYHLFGTRFMYEGKVSYVVDLGYKFEFKGIDTKEMTINHTSTPIVTIVCGFGEARQIPLYDFIVRYL